MVRVRARPSADACLEVDVLSAPGLDFVNRVGLDLVILSSMGYIRNCMGLPEPSIEKCVHLRVCA